ncbi:MAG TPA: DNA-processing protein DprA [Actinomycetota bacterium]|nr:DNA-processing protein DprA [Actinomycetota bacterium]
MPTVSVVSYGGPGYPPLLAETPGAPAALFVAGRSLEPAPHVAVVGTRRASRYGLEVGAWIGRELAAAGVVVVSGMAAGVDAAAHRGALSAGAGVGAGGGTLAVLGSGVDVCYPRANAALHREIAARGSLVSEYPPGTTPAPWRFPARNRIIAGLSLGVVIVEARRDGGAMITARLAVEYGREVFAIPGPVHAPGSEGPHALVRDGARLVASAQDVLEDLGLGGRSTWAQPALPESPVPPPLSPDERVLLGVLQAEPLLLDRIARLAGMPASAATAVLSRLELSGLATRHPGGRFARSVDAAFLVL